MEQTLLEPAAPATSITEYTRTAAALAELRQRYAGVVWDCSTAKGDRDARAVRKELVTLRTGLDKMRLQLNADDQARIKARNAEATRITGEIEELEKPVDEAIKAEEARKEAERERKALEEQRRVEAIQKRIHDDIRLAATAAVAGGSVEIEARIRDLAAMVVDDTFQEFREQAERAHAEALATLRGLHTAAVEREAEAARIAAERAELERLRAEQAKRDQLEAQRREAEQAADRQRLAEERAAFEAEQAAARAKREEEDRAAAAARAEADRIARQAREAEQRRLDEEAAALRRQREEQEARERAQREAAEAQARREREAVEARARQEREAAEAAERAERAAKETADRRVRDAAPLMFDALKKWHAADAAGDAVELQNARHARDEAITAATVADEIDELAY